MEWTERAIQKALCCSRGPVPFTRWIAVPNVTYGFCYTGEADLLAASPSGLLREYEIKISASDLRRDKLKDKHKFWEHPLNLVAELWYAMPLELAEWQSEEELALHIPEYAGVVAVSKDCLGLNRHRVMRKPTRKKPAPKLTPEQMLKLARLGYFRYWTHTMQAPQPNKESN